MTKYLISFPSGEMQLGEGGLQQAAADAHAVTREAKAVGVWVFGGGIDESIPPVRVDAAGNVTPDTYPQTARLEGGYAVLELPDEQAAYEWAAKLAAACRCPQEVRAFMDDPES